MRRASRYPIFSEKQNELTDFNGKKSFCFELETLDLDQLDEAGIYNFYSELKQSINCLDDNRWFKFYRIDSKSYICSNQDTQVLPTSTLKKLLNSKDSFFSAPVASDISFFENYLCVNTSYWRMLHMQTPPTDSYESFLDELNSDYIVCFKKISADVAKSKMAQTRRTQGVTLNTTHQNHEGEAAYHTANEFLKELTNSNESLFKINVWIFVKEDSIEKLNSKTNFLIKQLKLKGCSCFIETHGLDYFFNQALMGVTPSFSKSFTTNASYLANLLPMSDDYIHSEGISLSSTSGTEIFFNLLDQSSSNQNLLITGASGEGKSFLACSLMYELKLDRNSKLGIFDLGGSLKRMARYLGAEDLTQAFNPMQFKCPHYLKRFILAVIGQGELTRAEEGQLFSLIEASLEQEPKDFKELISYINDEMPGIKYYFSELWQYFNETNIKAPDVFYLDTKSLPALLIAPYLVFAKELSEAQEGRVTNIYDECWDIFSKCPGIIKQSAKTARKDLIANIFLTQEIVELTSEHTDVAKAVIGNTYTKIYFNQADLNHPILTNFEKQKIKQVKSSKDNYSEFFISSVMHKKIARLYVDPLIYELANSEKTHVCAQEQFVEDHEGILNYPQTIDKWTRLRYV